MLCSFNLSIIGRYGKALSDKYSDQRKPEPKIRGAIYKYIFCAAC